MTRVLIVGHGTAGRALAADAHSRGLEVVGFLDDRMDDPAVLAPLDDVGRIVAELGVDTVYFAIPSIDAARLRQFVGSLPAAGDLRFSIVPRTYDTISRESVAVDDLTDVDVLDLVGRSPVKHDLVTARAMVEGRRALVTGAAGSIGSRLVRLLRDLGASEVVCVDWWENGMFYLTQELGEDLLTPRIGDIRDPEWIAATVRAHRPNLVFHAAAFKHVPLMQGNAAQAVLNNVGGTASVIAASEGVEHLVYVSTDKAVNPVNVMGATKRLGELLVRDAARRSPGTNFTAVRFGNVIESNGSVMGTFRRQIAAGGPLTVTDPEVTRFFMTIDEASQLIVQSAVVGRSGDICVLDMGEPVRIADLARSIIAAVAPTIPIEFIGLRPGEKLYEELSYEPDEVVRTANGKIFRMREGRDPEVSVADISALVEAVRAREIDDAGALERLRELGFSIR